MIRVRGMGGGGGRRIHCILHHTPIHYASIHKYTIRSGTFADRRITHDGLEGGARPTEGVNG